MPDLHQLGHYKFAHGCCFKLQLGCCFCRRIVLNNMCDSGIDMVKRVFPTGQTGVDKSLGLRRMLSDPISMRNQYIAVKIYTIFRWADAAKRHPHLLQRERLVRHIGINRIGFTR